MNSEDRNVALYREVYHDVLSKRHRNQYIYWRDEAQIIVLSIGDYHDKLKEIRTNYKPFNAQKYGRTDRFHFQRGMYDEYVPENVRSKQYRIYVHDKDGSYIIYTTAKNGKGIRNKGEKAKSKVLEQFRAKTFLGQKAMHNAFGKAPIEWKVCTPKAIYYMNPLYISDPDNIQVIQHLNSIDGCSQFPFALCGSLPTTKDYKEIRGTVAPSEEYPFALYLNSGHVAIWNEFDTHDWLFHPLATRLFRNEADVKAHPEYPFTYAYLINFDPKNDITILMKKSDYTLTEEMQHFFKIKESAPQGSKEREDAKIVMNAFIGMFHQSKEHNYKRFPYCHISDIAIARANNNLLKVIDKMNITSIIHICVDGVIYKGSREFGISKRIMGEFEQEFSDCEGVFAGTNLYIIKDKNGDVIKAKHGSFDIYNSSKKTIDDNPPTNYYQLFDMTKTDNSSIYDKTNAYKKKEDI